MQETGRAPISHFAYDLRKCQLERSKLSKFLEYRKHFEKSQQVRI